MSKELQMAYGRIAQLEKQLELAHHQRRQAIAIGGRMTRERDDARAKGVKLAAKLQQAQKSLDDLVARIDAWRRSPDLIALQILPNDTATEGEFPPLVPRDMGLVDQRENKLIRQPGLRDDSDTVAG